MHSGGLVARIARKTSLTVSSRVGVAASVAASGLALAVVSFTASCKKRNFSEGGVRSTASAAQQVPKPFSE